MPPGRYPTETTTHRRGERRIAEVAADHALASATEGALEIVAAASSLGTRNFVLHESSLPPGFFSLRTGVAGEFLQKLGNYHIAIAVVCDLTVARSDSTQAFVRECNRGGPVMCVDSLDSALDGLSGGARAP